MGLLPIDKPAGPTSHDVVDIARKAFGIRRIGHTGTLDPFATGLLILAVGWATRLSEYIVGLDKVYQGRIRLGIETDSSDLTGAVVGRSEGWRDLSREEIERALERQLGEIDQVPPAHSAKRVGGERAYDRVRRGEVVELDPVRVVIRRLELLEVDLPELTFEVECSSGTYVRSIARDLGRELGTGGHLTELRRTRIGSFDIGEAVSVSQLDDPEVVRGALISPLAAVAHLPEVEVSEADARALRHGARVPIDRSVYRADGPLAISEGGELIAIGEIEGNALRARKVFQSG